MVLYHHNFLSLNAFVSSNVLSVAKFRSHTFKSVSLNYFFVSIYLFFLGVNRGRMTPKKPEQPGIKTENRCSLNLQPEPLRSLIFTFCCFSGLSKAETQALTNYGSGEDEEEEEEIEDFEAGPVDVQTSLQASADGQAEQEVTVTVSHRDMCNSCSFHY